MYYVVTSYNLERSSTQSISSHESEFLHTLTTVFPQIINNSELTLQW